MATSSISADSEEINSFARSMSAAAVEKSLRLSNWSAVWFSVLRRSSIVDSRLDISAARSGLVDATDRSPENSSCNRSVAIQMSATTSRESSAYSTIRGWGVTERIAAPISHAFLQGVLSVLAWFVCRQQQKPATSEGGRRSPCLRIGDLDPHLKCLRASRRGKPAIQARIPENIETENRGPRQDR